MHRALLYSKLPELNISVPKINTKIPRSSTVDNYKLVCYYTFPNKLETERQLYHSDIDPNLCTHINIGFGWIENNTIVIENDNKNVTKNMVGLKKYNKNLKIILSITGKGEDGFGDMVINHANRKM